MKLLRSIAVYLYVIGKVASAPSYFKKLEAKRELLGEDGIAAETHAFGQSVAKNVLKLSGCTFEVKGKENLPKEGTALYVANHQSYMDIVAVMSVIERPVGFVVKEELAKVPFFDKWLEQFQCVAIARGEVRKALEAILRAAKLMKGGRDMMLFPEGTRSKDGTLLNFKAGSLKAAQRGNAMIVPMAIDGACDVMPRDKFLVHPKKITVTVFPAIPAEQVKELDTVELALLVRNQIAGALGQEVINRAQAEQQETEDQQNG